MAPAMGHACMVGRVKQTKLQEQSMIVQKNCARLYTCIFPYGHVILIYSYMVYIYILIACMQLLYSEAQSATVVEK